MTINECSNCGMRGYEYKDEARKLCHMCVFRENHNKAMVAELIPILRQLHSERWDSLEHGRGLLLKGCANAINQYGGNIIDVING